MLRTKPGSIHRRRLAELGDFGDLDLRDLSDDKVRFAYRTQCFFSALDTLGLCQFVWGSSWQLYGPSETVELVRSGTGWDADVLPKKLFQPLGGKGPTSGVALTTEEFEHARDSYYRLAGCEPTTGHPTPAKLRDLGLDWLVPAP
jgi:aldehyde:ferredoxin oxidoreductase